MFILFKQYKHPEGSKMTNYKKISELLKEVQIMKVTARSLFDEAYDYLGDMVYPDDNLEIGSSNWEVQEYNTHKGVLRLVSKDLNVILGIRKGSMWNFSYNGITLGKTRNPTQFLQNNALDKIASIKDPEITQLVKDIKRAINWDIEDVVEYKGNLEIHIKTDHPDHDSYSDSYYDSGDYDSEDGDDYGDSGGGDDYYDAMSNILDHLAKKVREVLKKSKANFELYDADVDTYSGITFILKPKGKRADEMSMLDKKGATRNNYEILHGSYTSAMQEAYDYAEANGYLVDEEDIFQEVTTGKGRPGIGKTRKHSLLLLKGDKVQRKALQVQVYGMENGAYELNAYIQ